MMFYIFRHAEKKSTWDHDPNLTEQGFKQSQKLSELVQSKKLPHPYELISSPRTRAQNSFLHLSNTLSLPLKTDPRLLERQSSESRNQFLHRIQSVLEELYQKKSISFLCSHYDWVIESMDLITSDSDLTQPQFQHWLPMQYVGFEVVKNICKVIDNDQVGK